MRVTLALPALFLHDAHSEECVPPYGERPGELIHVWPLPPDGSRERAAIYTGWNTGDVDVHVETLPAHPDDSDLAHWETVEQNSIDFSGPAALFRYTNNGPPLQLLQHIGVEGLHGVRVSARGRDRTRSDTVIRIELWPTPTRLPPVTIKTGDDFTSRALARRYGKFYPPAGTSEPTVAEPRRCESSTADSSIRDRWHELIPAVSHHTGQPIEQSNGVASGAACDAAQSRTGVTWPIQLREWFNFAGQLPATAAAALPYYDILTPDQAADSHQLQVGIWRDLIDMDPDVLADRSVDDYAADPAGTEVGMFLPFYVPFAERDGNLLVCDNRSGPLHGCVLAFDSETADSAAPQWRSLAAMVTDISEELQAG